MTRLSSLLRYSVPLTQLLLSLPSGSWNRASTTPGPVLPQITSDADSRTVLGRWTIDVIETLVSVLEQKSRTQLRPRSPMAAHLFILNNLSEIEKRVRTDRTMQSIVGGITSVEKEQSKRGSRSSSGSNHVQTFSMPKSFEKVKRGGLDGISCCGGANVGYLDGYKDAVSHLLDVTYIKGGSNRSSGSLSGKEREAVKERFRVMSLATLL